MIAPAWAHDSPRLCAFLATAAFVVTIPLLEGLRRWALARAVLDHPNERSSHTSPTPRGGGLAIVLVTLAGFAGCQWLLHPFAPRVAWTLIACGAALAATGWMDDLGHVDARVRLAIHLAIAAITAGLAGHFQTIWLPGLGDIHLGAFGFVVAVIWITGMTNAFNFMDGIDGIAGVQALVAGGGWLLLGLLFRSSGLALLGALIAGSSLAFLLRNWQPARIFMGDVGSTFLGYLFATLAVIGGERNPRLAVAGMLLVWPFIFDTALTLLRRMDRREQIFEAHRSHLYQRLVVCGTSHSVVALLYSALALLGVCSAAAVALRVSLTPTLLSVPVAALTLWRLIIWRERKTGTGLPGEGGSVPPH